MKVFKVNAPEEWKHLLTGDKIEVQARGPRRVEFEFNVTERTAVFLRLSPDKRTLLGCSDGQFTVSATIQGGATIEVESQKGALIYYYSRAKSHAVRHSEKEAYTTPAPFGKRTTDQDRILAFMLENQQKRDSLLQSTTQSMAKLQAKAAELERKLAEKEQVIETPETGDTEASAAE